MEKYAGLQAADTLSLSVIEPANLTEKTIRWMLRELEDALNSPSYAMQVFAQLRMDELESELLKTDRSVIPRYDVPEQKGFGVDAFALAVESIHPSEYSKIREALMNEMKVLQVSGLRVHARMAAICVRLAEIAQAEILLEEVV